MEDKYSFRLWLAATIVLPPVYFLLLSEEGWKAGDPVGWWVSLVILMALFIGLVSPYVLENVRRWQKSRAASRKSTLVLPESHQWEKPSRNRLRAGMVLAFTSIVFGMLVSAATYTIATTTTKDSGKSEQAQDEAPQDDPKLDLIYRANALRVAPEALPNPTVFASHACRIACDVVNRSGRNMSLKFALLIRTRSQGKDILYPCYGTWDIGNGEGDKSDISVLNIDRESAIADALLTFVLPDPQKVDFDFKSWDEVGYTRATLLITDEVTGAVGYTDNLMQYPWKKGDQGDLAAAFKDWHQLRKESGNSTVGMPPVIGSVEDLFRALGNGASGE